MPYGQQYGGTRSATPAKPPAKPWWQQAAQKAGNWVNQQVQNATRNANNPQAYAQRLGASGRGVTPGQIGKGMTQNYNPQGLVARYGTSPNAITPGQAAAGVAQGLSNAAQYVTRNANDPGMLAGRYGGMGATGVKDPFADAFTWKAPTPPAPGQFGGGGPKYQPGGYDERMSQRAQNAWAQRNNALAANYFAKPETPLTTPPAADQGGGYGGYGGWGGGGGGGGYEDVKSWFNSMVQWSINQPKPG